MTFADVLAAQKPARKGPLCVVCRCIESWDATDAKELEAALANPEIQTVIITRAIAATGTNVSASSVARHRRGDCHRSQEARE